MCKGSNTEGEDCKCKFGSIPVANSLSCSDTFPGMSVVIVTPGIVIGENDDGSIIIGNKEPKGEDNICVKTTLVIAGDHEGEKDASVRAEDNNKNKVDSSAKLEKEKQDSVKSTK